MTKKAKDRSRKHILYGKGGVRYELPKGLGGPVQIRIDFAQIPAPPNYFYADTLTLRIDRSLLMAILSFAQRKGSGGISEPIDIAMPQTALLGGFWQSTRKVEKTVDEALARLGVKLTDLSTKFDKDAIVTLYANILHIAVGPGETSLDFYCLSPRDVHLARTQRGEMSLQPIVRVVMSTVLTKHFFDQLRPHARQVGASNQAERKEDRAAIVR